MKNKRHGIAVIPTTNIIAVCLDKVFFINNCILFVKRNWIKLVIVNLEYTLYLNFIPHGQDFFKF